MHELSVCVAMLDQVERIAQGRPNSKVTRIVIKLGPLAGIEPELLRRSYPLAAEGTIAAQAKLQIDQAEVVVRCTQCGAESDATANRLLCGTCGDFRTRIVSGDEMLLQSVELRSVEPGQERPG